MFPCVTMPKRNKPFDSEHGYLQTSTYAILILLTLLFGFIFQCPLGDPCQHITLIKEQWSLRPAKGIDYICEAYKIFVEVAQKAIEMCQFIFRLIVDALYQVKIKIYKILALMDGGDLCHYACFNDADYKDMKKIKSKPSSL